MAGLMSRPLLEEEDEGEAGEGLLFPEDEEEEDEDEDEDDSVGGIPSSRPYRRDHILDSLAPPLQLYVLQQFTRSALRHFAAGEHLGVRFGRRSNLDIAADIVAARNALENVAAAYPARNALDIAADIVAARNALGQRLGERSYGKDSYGKDQSKSKSGSSCEPYGKGGKAPRRCEEPCSIPSCECGGRDCCIGRQGHDAKPCVQYSQLRVRRPRLLYWTSRT